MPELLISPDDHDAGFKDVPIEYRRGSVPEGCPETLRISALSHRSASKIATEPALSDEPYWPFLRESLPEKYRDEAFLNRLTMESYGRLQAAAIALAFGDSFQKKIQAIVTRGTS